jgi:hypothetical protein
MLETTQSESHQVLSNGLVTVAMPLEHVVLRARAKATSTSMLLSTRAILGSCDASVLGGEDVPLRIHAEDNFTPVFAAAEHEFALHSYAANASLVHFLLGDISCGLRFYDPLALAVLSLFRPTEVTSLLDRLLPSPSVPVTSRKQATMCLLGTWMHAVMAADAQNSWLRNGDGSSHVKTCAEYLVALGTVLQPEERAAIGAAAALRAAIGLHDDVEHHWIAAASGAPPENEAFLRLAMDTGSDSADESTDEEWAMKRVLHAETCADATQGAHLLQLLLFMLTRPAGRSGRAGDGSSHLRAGLLACDGLWSRCGCTVPCSSTHFLV